MLKKVYLNKANENWILDRLRSEWYLYNKSVSTKIVSRSDIIWICSPWTWKKIPKKYLIEKKVICSIYHIDEDKFSEEDLIEFSDRDQYTDFYHVISENSKRQLSKYTNKKIISIPFWADSKMWFEIQDKNIIKKNLGIPADSFIIGSFQRDTEGSDLHSPKLSKGPDRFIEIVEEIKKQKSIFVLLSGKRREYVIKELTKLNIKFKYFEMADSKLMNELYNCLDLYIVASRVEGGPQAIIECALSKTPIISTDVGVAKEILAPESIFNMQNFMNATGNIEIAYKNASEYVIPNGFKNYLQMLGTNSEN